MLNEAGGVVHGNPRELELAGIALRPVSGQVSELAAQVSSQGGRAAGGAGGGAVAAALTGLASTVARVAGDTGVVVAQLGEVAVASAEGFRAVGASVHTAGGGG